MTDDSTPFSSDAYDVMIERSMPFCHAIHAGFYAVK